ncbi:MAG: FHA domain-containing protein [Thermoleophilaceae bacterium]|nr:FHA domain-containing protein [Thermoleophilaceae bacterium]
MLEALNAGTLVGAGSFRCHSCGFAVALEERDQLPDCPHCGSDSFKRASMFGFDADAEPIGTHRVEHPEWLDSARDALVEPGFYLGFDDGERVHVVPIEDGWTRIGRSLAAHVRFDDPTVSRRHALMHCEPGGTRILDDRSLNGVFVNGERAEWHELSDGDQIDIGRYSLFFMSLDRNVARSLSGDVQSAR